MKTNRSAHKQRREIIKQASHKRLRLNLQILGVVYVVLAIVTIVHLIRTPLSWWQVPLCIVIGLTAGLISSRMNKISWDSEQAKVVGRIDTYGAIVLVLFIVFEVFRSQLAGLFVSGEAISSASFLILTFTMYGRIAGTASRILAVAKQEFFSTSHDAKK